MSDWQGKRCIVTGASSGIGKCTAILLAQKGAVVCLVARRKATMDEIIQKEMGGKGFAIQADFQDPVQCARCVVEAARLLGGIDVLINNAGGAVTSQARPGSAFASESTEVQAALRIVPVIQSLQMLNYISVEVCTTAAIPYLKQSRGCIVNVSSVAGSRPSSGIHYYNTAKAALDMATRAAAFRYAKHGIRVNAVAPAAVATPIFRAAAEQAGRSLNEEQEQKLITDLAKKYPILRIGEPADVAEAICFLASEKQSGFTTGHILHLDGGLLLTSAL